LIGVAREDFIGAVASLPRESASDPALLIKHAQAMIRIMNGKSDLPPDPKDRRFVDPA